MVLSSVYTYKTTQINYKVTFSISNVTPEEVFKVRAGTVTDVNFELFEHFVMGLLDPEQVKAVLAPHCPPFLEYRRSLWILQSSDATYSIGNPAVKDPFRHFSPSNSCLAPTPSPLKCS